MDCIHSPNGFVSTSWGPVLWYLLHVFSFHTSTDLDTLHNWFLLLEHVLPCKACRVNFRRNLDESAYDPHHSFQTLDDGAEFLWHFHHCVNKCLGKRVSLSFKQARQMYSCNTRRTIRVNINDRSRCTLITPQPSMCFCIEQWFFILMIVVMNYPLTWEEHCRRGEHIKSWIRLFIRLIPNAEDRDAIEQQLRPYLQVHTARWNRSTLAYCVYRCMCHCIHNFHFTFAQVLRSFEDLRAELCTTSTKTQEGTCKKQKMTITTTVE